MTNTRKSQRIENTQQPQRPQGRAPQSGSPDWKCLHQQQSGWIPLDDPKFVFEAMIPGKTRVDNAVFGPLQAGEVNVGAIGKDEREPWANTVDPPYRWICKLSVVFQSRNGGDLHYAESSGILIGNRHVLTAAHALFDPVFTNGTHVDTREARAVVVIPGLNGIHSDPQRLMPFGWSWGTAFRTTDDARRTMRVTYPAGTDISLPVPTSPSSNSSMTWEHVPIPY